MPSPRQVAKALVIGLSFATIARIALTRFRRRRKNRLFLYEIPTGTNSFGRAAVATIGPSYFQIESEYTYSDWTFVTSAAKGNNKWLFFHNYSTGSAATGWIDTHFNVRNSKFYAPGSLDFPYYSAVVDGRGYLMCIGYGSPGKVLIGFAQVLDDGTYVEWWRTELSDFPNPDGAPIIGLKNAHTWFTNNPGGGATVYIFDVKRGQMLSTRAWDAPIRWMVADGDLIFIYFGDSLKSTELCILDSNQQLVTLKHTEFDFAAYTVFDFDRIASTPGAHLLYSYQSFTAHGAIRVLSRDGFKLTQQLSNMDWRYHYFVQC
jgi:hypothetical protein